MVAGAGIENIQRKCMYGIEDRAKKLPGNDQAYHLMHRLIQKVR